MTDEILRDEGLSKEQLKELLGHMPIYTKSAALLMYSSGIRIGEALLLEVDDLHLDEDPPYADVRAEYTMGRNDDRRVWFSHETRDALNEWFKVKDTRRKKTPGGEVFPKDMVWGFGIGTWMYSWNKARKEINSEAGYHTLRRSFRLNMRKAGMPGTIVHALMGHKQYSDRVFDRFTIEEIARMYKEHMHAVSIYDTEEIQPC